MESKTFITIIIAAGQSSRFGSPKQLFRLGDLTLLENAIEASVQSMCNLTIVVLGANRDKIFESLWCKDSESLVYIYNENWIHGMSSSIVCGVHYLLQQNVNFDGIIISMCDQPFLTKEVFNALIREFDHDKASIVNCNYGLGFGPPVVFSKKYINELLLIKGDQGAKPIVTKYIEQVRHIAFPNGQIDIDRIEDTQNVG